MKNQPEIQPQDLENITRRFVSRHQAIPPTPRDTLAVLRQAAEARKDSPGQGWIHLLTRGLIAVAVCAALALGIWSLELREKGAVAQADQSEADLGLDLADWDLEFDAIYKDLDLTIANMNVEEASL